MITAVAGTLNTGDVLADGSTTDNDVLNATMTSGAVEAPSLTNIETINLDVKTGGSGLNMGSVTGAKQVNVTTDVAASLNSVATATAPKIGLTGSGNLTVGLNNLAGSAATNSADVLNVKLDGAAATATAVPTLTLNNGGAGTEVLEVLNIESAGTAKNTVTVATTNIQAIGKTVVTGATDLELRGAAATFNNSALDASAHTGVMTVRADFNGAGALIGLNAEKFTGVDAYVVTDSASATTDAFGLYNIATGSTVRVADDFTLAGANSIITVTGAATNAADSLTVNLQNRAATATDVDLTGLTVGNVENITISSSGAPKTGAAAAQQNSIGALTANALQNLVLTGDSNLAVTLTAGSITAANTSNITIDGSAMTGQLVFNAGNVANNAGTRGLTIKGGTGNDQLTGSSTVAVKNIFDLSAGGNDRVTLAVGDTNDEIIGFANGDTLALGSVAGGFTNGLSSAVINAAGQASIEAAADVGAAATAAAVAAGGLAVNEALLFSYQGNQYIFMNEDTANAYDAATDAVVKVTGMSATTAFDAGTFLFAV